MIFRFNEDGVIIDEDGRDLALAIVNLGDDRDGPLILLDVDVLEVDAIVTQEGLRPPTVWTPVSTIHNYSVAIIDTQCGR